MLLAGLEQGEHVLARPLVHQVLGEMRTGAAPENDATVVIDHDLDRIMLRDSAENAPVAIGDLAHDLLLGLAGIGVPEGAHLLGLFDIAARDAHLVAGD